MKKLIIFASLVTSIGINAKAFDCHLVDLELSARAGITVLRPVSEFIVTINGSEGLTLNGSTQYGKPIVNRLNDSDKMISAFRGKIRSQTNPTSVINIRFETPEVGDALMGERSVRVVPGVLKVLGRDRTISLEGIRSGLSVACDAGIMDLITL